MNITWRTEGLTLDDEEKERLNKRFGRLSKHLKPPFHIDVLLAQDARHRKGNVVECRVNLEISGHKNTLYADRTGETAEKACDAALEVIEQELRKAHDKNKQHR